MAFVCVCGRVVDGEAWNMPHGNPHHACHISVLGGESHRISLVDGHLCIMGPPKKKPIDCFRSHNKYVQETEIVHRSLLRPQPRTNAHIHIHPTRASERLFDSIATRQRSVKLRIKFYYRRAV